MSNVGWEKNVVKKQVVAGKVYSPVASGGPIIQGYWTTEIVWAKHEMEKERK